MVALKVIYEHSSSQRIKGEILCLHKLRSLDCTIEIFDVFHHKNINVMVLEYVESEPEQVIYMIGLGFALGLGLEG